MLHVILLVAAIWGGLTVVFCVFWHELMVWTEVQDRWEDEAEAEAREHAQPLGNVEVLDNWRGRHAS